MKNIRKYLSTLLVLGLFLGLNSLSMAQGGPPPPPEYGHGATGDQPPEGGNAPLGSGLILLIGLGIVYAIKQTYEAHSLKEEKS